MYVGIKYFKEKGNCYAGGQYTYTTNLPLEIGNTVLAPTAKAPEGSRAIVTAVNVPEPPFVCREITEYYVEENDDAGN